MASHDLLERRAPGIHAKTPAQIPRRGWWQILKRTRAEISRDQIPLLAAGVAFYSFLSLFPALIASLMIYGLVLDPADVRTQAAKLTAAMPDDAAALVTRQLEALAATSDSSLGIGLAFTLALALWSASGGVGNLITAINTAYDEVDERGFVQRKLLSLGLTLAAIVFAVLSLGLIAAAPAVLDDVVGPGTTRMLLEAVRWTFLLILMAGALAVLYRLAPDRENPRLSWVSVGAVAATVGWLVVSLGFSLYVDNFGSYGETYGAVAGVVVLLLWLWLTMFLVLVGAELNAESEQQTIADTTTGPPRPLGSRGAVKADTVPGQEPGTDGS